MTKVVASEVVEVNEVDEKYKRKRGERKRKGVFIEVSANAHSRALQAINMTAKSLHDALSLVALQLAVSGGSWR